MVTFTTRKSSARDFHIRTLIGGITYSVTYFGCVRVNTRMQMLGAKSRLDVARECFTKICEYSMLQGADKIRKDEAAENDIPSFERTGLVLNMVITCTKIEFTLPSNGNVLACYELVNVLDVFLGEWVTSSFVGFIVKNGNSDTFCFLLKCPQSTANFIFISVRESFTLRFGEYHRIPGESIMTIIHQSFGDICIDGYHVTDLVPRDRYGPSRYINEYKQLKENVKLTYCTHHARSRVDDDIDEINLDYIRKEDSTVAVRYFTHSIFFTLLLEVEDPLIRLKREMWFHGAINELQAERLLLKDGDFLVRQETATFGRQFLLSGRDDNRIVHLYLLNEEGDIKTTDTIYKSVNELVEFHYGNALPVLSPYGALTLKHKIFRSEHSVLS